MTLSSFSLLSVSLWLINPLRVHHIYIGVRFDRYDPELPVDILIGSDYY